MKKIINYIIFLIFVFSILTIVVRLFLNPDSPTEYLQGVFRYCGMQFESDCEYALREFSRVLTIFIVQSNIFLFFTSLLYFIISSFSKTQKTINIIKYFILPIVPIINTLLLYRILFTGGGLSFWSFYGIIPIIPSYFALVGYLIYNIVFLIVITFIFRKKLI